MRVDLDSEEKIRGVLKQEEGVKAACREEAEAIAARAKPILAAHKYTGNASIGVTSGDVDSYAYLDDPAAMSIEKGHQLVYFGTPTDKYIEGIYALTRAAGLM